jgi:hypothetical protein
MFVSFFYRFQAEPGFLVPRLSLGTRVAKLSLGIRVARLSLGTRVAKLSLGTRVAQNSIYLNDIRLLVVGKVWHSALASAIIPHEYPVLPVLRLLEPQSYLPS